MELNWQPPPRQFAPGAQAGEQEEERRWGLSQLTATPRLGDEDAVARALDTAVRWSALVAALLVGGGLLLVLAAALWSALRRRGRTCRRVRLVLVDEGTGAALREHVALVGCGGGDATEPLDWPWPDAPAGEVRVVAVCLDDDGAAQVPVALAPGREPRTLEAEVAGVRLALRQQPSV